MKRTAINISLLEAQRAKKFDDTRFVIISILDEGWQYQLNIPRNDKILCLNFSDIIQDEVINNNKTYHGINTTQAKKIYDFCLQNNDKNFIVHCHAGVSRSSAVCLYLNLVYNHVLRNDFFEVSRPNYRVLHKLLEQHNFNQ